MATHLGSYDILIYERPSLVASLGRIARPTDTEVREMILSAGGYSADLVDADTGRVVATVEAKNERRRA